MVAEAELSFTDQKGYYGLTVMPSYDAMLRSLKKPIRIPQPDRSAKYYALGPYRAFLLQQAQRFNDFEREALEYDATGAELPRAAALGHQGSAAGNDDYFNRSDHFNANLNAEEARRLAEGAMAAERKRQANQVRRMQLSSYGPSSGHWVVDAHDRDLEHRGVPHAKKLPPMAMPAGQWQAPPTEYIATGVPQAPEFPTFEQLNGMHEASYKLGRPASEVNKNYQQLRENAALPHA